MDLELRHLLAHPSVVAVILSDVAGEPSACAALAPEARDELETCVRYLSSASDAPASYVLLRDGGLVVHVDVGEDARVWVLLDAMATPAELDAVFRLARHGDSSHELVEDAP